MPDSVFCCSRLPRLVRRSPLSCSQTLLPQTPRLFLYCDDPSVVAVGLYSQSPGLDCCPCPSARSVSAPAPPRAARVRIRPPPGGEGCLCRIPARTFGWMGQRPAPGIVFCIGLGAFAVPSRSRWLPERLQRPSASRGRGRRRHQSCVVLPAGAVFPAAAAQRRDLPLRSRRELRFCPLARQACPRSWTASVAVAEPCGAMARAGVEVPPNASRALPQPFPCGPPPPTVRVHPSLPATAAACPRVARAPCTYIHARPQRPRCTGPYWPPRGLALPPSRTPAVSGTMLAPAAQRSTRPSCPPRLCSIEN